MICYVSCYAMLCFAMFRKAGEQRGGTGHARAPMVLGPFAETKEPVLSLSKEPRRAGAKPRTHTLHDFLRIIIRNGVPSNPNVARS